MEHFITPDIEKKIEHYFHLLDQDKDGLINHDEVKILFRALGQSISEKDLLKILEGEKEFFDIKSFLKFYKKHYMKPLTQVDLLEAFELMDTNQTGVIHVDKFRSLLLHNSEPLTNKEIDYIISNCPVDDQQYISYKSIVNVLSGDVISNDGPLQR